MQSNIPMPQQRASLMEQLMQQIANGQAAQVMQILQSPQGQQIFMQLSPEEQKILATALQQSRGQVAPVPGLLD
jgi:hypothetical protein